MSLPPELQDFLLKETDPSVQYRVLRFLLDRPEDDPEVQTAREQIGRAGWVAQIMRTHQPEGQWDTAGTSARDLYTPKYISTNWRLLVLSDLGVTRAFPGIEPSVRLFLNRFSTEEDGLGGKDSEVCFTGNAVRMLVRLGFQEEPLVRKSIDWLLKTQLADGGWHCDPSATQGTLDCWEALAAFATLPPQLRTEGVRRSIERGAEFYLERGLWHEGSTTYAPWLRWHYPTHYYYDLLVGLDVLTALGYATDPRIRPALQLLEERRNSNGSWNLDAQHPDVSPEESYQPRTPIYPFVLELADRPSRWITTTAAIVLQRSGRL
ncbi:MAG: prenyltransferase/squalene oxidase repeat-containing protein [Thermoplasmata archaeon]